LSRLTLALALALLALESAVAIWIVATSEQTGADSFAPAIPAGMVFVLSGLVALVRRPESMTGVYLAATGYLWLLVALGESGESWIYTIGFALTGLVWVPFGALVLSYPTGRLETRLERAIPVAAGVLLTSTALVRLLVDETPAPDRCDVCPESAIAIADLPWLATAARIVSAVGSVVLIALVIGLFVRRWRAASPPLRRVLAPVLGAATLTLLAAGAFVVGDQVSETAGESLLLVLYVVFTTVPLAFLYGVLRMRLARSSVAQVVTALERGVPLRDALASALGDPWLELAYRVDPTRGVVAGDGWVDPLGRAVAEPSPSATRAVRFVQRGGERIAALEYDASLANEPELVETVTAAAGLALANERLQAALRAEIRLTGALIDTAPALVSTVDTTGRFIQFNQATLRASGYEHVEDIRGRPFWEVFIDEDERGEMIARFAAAAPDYRAAEYENTFTNVKGERLVIYWRAAPVHDEQGNVVSIVAAGLDLSERHRLELEKEREREFLNAIANNAPSLLCLVDDRGRVTDRGSNTAFERSLGYAPEEIGGQVFWEQFVAPEDVEAVRHVIERVAGGEELGEHDHHWRTANGDRLIIAWTCTPLPSLDERRLFLISGSDVTIRRRQEEEIRASRARLVAAEDDARRKLERNLHDGAQQRLVALSVALRLAETKLGKDPEGAESLLAGAREELGHALEELRELARGIHPAVLTARGLGPALESLISRMTIPVDVRHPDERLAPAVEAAAYYVVAESLTNVTKYARASEAAVEVTRDDGRVVVTVTDDGVGGADPRSGSGLRGLADRVAALDGVLVVESAAGSGTRIRAEIPIPAEAEQ
jgi:PAS domain S-box-containing protein